LQNVATKYILIRLMHRIEFLRAKGYIITPPRQSTEGTYTSPVRQSVKPEERSEECERQILQILHVVQFRVISLWNPLANITKQSPESHRSEAPRSKRRTLRPRSDRAARSLRGTQATNYARPCAGVTGTTVQGKL
jgi:hypothetical protein